MKYLLRLNGFIATILLLAVPFGFAQAQEMYVSSSPADQATQVHTGGAGLVSRVAPGEFLPLSVTLSNFGSQKKVDVLVSYDITDAHGMSIYSARETVAVETTASFVKTIQIPFGTLPGQYTAKSSLTYDDQVVPATTAFPFRVERKIAGLFESDFYLYTLLTLVVSLIAGMVGHLWAKRRRRTRSAPIDYSAMPRTERVFYELISDTIAQMRQHEGDEALEIAKSIEDLVIDERTGRVLKLKKSPAKIMALLVLKYEQLLGQKVNFAFSHTAKIAEEQMASIDKNLITIKKYLN